MGPRLACLLVPDLPLVAALRAEPELAGEPLIIADGPGPRAGVLAASLEAVARGVRPPCTVTHARAACADARMRLASPALESAARQALLDAALSTSPRAEVAPRAAGLHAAEAAVYLDASGLESLFGSEAGFAAALSARTWKLGLPAAVAVAGSREVAQIAARRLVGGLRARGLPLGEGLTELVPAGGDAAFLAPLPIDLLDPDDALAETLQRFGIRRVRDLVRLPRRALQSRLGEDARRLLVLARGVTSAPPPTAPPPKRMEEASDLEFSVDRLEPLVFVLRGLLSRLHDRLECRGLGFGELSLRLALEGGGRHALRVGVAAPTRDVRSLLRLLSLALESRPPAAPIQQVFLATEGRPVRDDQLDFFHPAGPAPAVLSKTLAELEALCGPGRVGAPALVDSHRPDAFGLAAFRPGQATRCREAPLPYDAGQPRFEERHLAVRALRPPIPAQVRDAGGRPAWVRSAVANGRVLGVAGPWRTTGSWWSAEDRFAFDHYDVETSDGLVTRLRFDRVQGRWQIDAVYD